MGGRNSYLRVAPEEGAALTAGLGQQSFQKLQEVEEGGKREGIRMHDDASEGGCGLGYGSARRGTERRI